MATELSSQFSDEVMERINGVLMEYRKEHKVVNDTGDIEKFALPYRYAVIQGLFSGETQEGCFFGWLRKKSCKRVTRRACDRGVEKLIGDVFGAAYVVGEELGKIEDLRDDERKIKYLSHEQGIRIISMVGEGLEINFDNGQDLARDIWAEYSRGMAPRFAA